MTACSRSASTRAGDAGDKVELIGMLNYAIDQMRALVGKLEAEQ